MDAGIRTRITVAGVAVAGIAAAALAVVGWGDAGLGRPLVLAGFTVALALDWLFPLLVLRGEETEAFQLDEAFLVLTLLFLPPLGVLAVFVVGATIAQLGRRRPASRLAFNAGQLSVAVVAASAVSHTVGDHGDPRLGPAAVLGLVAAALAFLAVNSLAVSVVVAAASGTPVRRVAADGLGFRVLVSAATVAVGLLAGMAAVGHPWALALAIVPVIGLQLVLGQSLRSRRDRMQLDGLLKAAMQAHASVDPVEVERTLTSSGAELLGARAARIADAPPREGEIGARIPGERSGRWLVASDRLGVEGFGEDQQRVLDALAVIGSGALATADLVAQVKHQAFHDALTGLPNMVLFEQRLDFALTQARRTGDHVAVLFIDLDDFKKVNDALGHPAGNELLRQVSARLQERLRESDTLARMGGDELTVLLTGLQDANDATRAAAGLREALRQPFSIDGVEVAVTASIGVAVHPEAGDTPADLLRNADLAMYEAKQRGRDGWHRYTPGMDEALATRLALEADLRHAIATGALDVAYQPQVNLRTGVIVGVEALVRWEHPTRGLIPPDHFIGVAEASGLIEALDGWVLDRACGDLRRWIDAGLPPLRMAVNASGRDFRSGAIVARVQGTLARHGVPADLLELEVTEGIALDPTVDLLATFERLRALGVHLAMDDFGTGYSMLGRLRDLPIGKLKIDRSFIEEVRSADAPAPLVEAMVAMAHGLRLTVVAEGVETVAQWDLLDRLGCDQAQGYLLSRPITSDAVVDLLRGQHLARAAS